jgi:RND superfamily putative drug exporter
MGSWLTRAYAAAVVALRWPIVLAWVVATVAAVIALPPLSQRSAGSLGSIVPENSEALTAQKEAARAFSFPLFSQTIIAHREAGGMSLRDQLDWGLSAARLTRHGGARVPDPDGGTTPVAGAIPLVNAAPLAGATPEHGTAALAYLVFRPSVAPADRAQAAAALADRFHTPVHVTGIIPARLTLTEVILDRLGMVELATGLLVALVVGLHFRSIGAPLATLAAIAVAYLIAVRVIPWLGAAVGIDVPREVAPMIVVLLFGALTDYTIFLLSRCRARLAEGAERKDAARTAVRQIAGIVTVAAAIVTGASATLTLARFDFFQAFGPGMAATIAIGWLVAITLVPALLAIFGNKIFWPGRPSGRAVTEGPRRRLLGVVARHPVPIALLVLAALLAGASGLIHLRLANPAIRGQPAGVSARAGYQDITAGFGPGFAAPTLVVIHGRDLDRRRAALARLQRALEGRPRVAAVLGPRDNPLPGTHGVFVAADGRTARLALVLDEDPLGARAIADVRELRANLHGLLDAAGLDGASALVGGDTALSADTIALAVGDLAVVAPAVLLVVFALLALYLRAFVVPLLLLASSALALATALGIAVWVWRWLGGGDLAYYVPFAVAVLLLALGSDYSVLLAGRIWDKARRPPLSEAIADAATQAAPPITTAGLVLAGSFALLALVPLWEFRQFALAMAAGLLVDAFVVRSLLAPALVAFAGRLGVAPANRLAEQR